VPPSRLERFGPIVGSQIQPASIDVRLGGEFIRHPDGQKFSTDSRYPYRLSPGECVLASLVETLYMRERNVVARIEGKSSWARKFLTIHSAGFVDPGFVGDLTLEIKNDGMVMLELVPGIRIAQISFQFLSAPADRLYGNAGLKSHYQGQKGPTQSWLSGSGASSGIAE
jgi:dCTP deaminase